MASPIQYADHTQLRLQLADLRNQLDAIRHEIYWNDRLGATCDHLNKALQHLLAARDHSHDWEFRPHPALDAPCKSTSLQTSNSSSSSPAAMSSI